MRVIANHEFHFNSSDVISVKRNVKRIFPESKVPIPVSPTSPKPITPTNKPKGDFGRKSYLVVLATTEEADIVAMTKWSYL